MQTAKVASSASLFQGSALTKSVPLRTARPFRSINVVVKAAEDRLRLHNLSPAEGSRRQEKRKGRGHAAGQGGTCGFGNRGQKSRSGPGVRPGFEGGQTALYRRLPKLRGIAGGMPSGLPKFVVVNLDDLEKNFEAQATVTLDSLVEKGIVRISGRDEKLPLKVLGTGELSKPLTIKAAAFSGSAMEKIAAAGGQAEQLAQKAKWTRKAYEKLVAEYAAEGKDYKAEQLKRKAAAKAKKAKKVAA